MARGCIRNMYCTFVPFMQNIGARSLVKLGQRLKVLMWKLLLHSNQRELQRKTQRRRRRRRTERKIEEERENEIERKISSWLK